MENFDGIKSHFYQWENDEKTEALLSTLSLIESKIQALENIEKNEASHNFVLESLFGYMEKFYKKAKTWKKPTKYSDYKIVIFESKLKSICEILDVAYLMPKNDLCWIDKSHERWLKLNSFIDYVEVQDPESLRKSYNKFFQNIVISRAFISNAVNEQNEIKRNFIIGIGAIYYFLFKSEAKRQSSLFCANSSVESAQTMWDLLDSWICKSVLSVLMTSIKENTVIYVPRTGPHVITGETQEFSTDYTLTPNDDYVPIRILSHLSILKEELRFELCNSRLPAKFDSDTDIIFHIHGGGFVTMSSFSHQSYTRKWAKKLKIPVFSVDYKLAPKHPFPRALDDVWQAYIWIINYYSTLGITIKKLIITGDSAGGNLALGVAYKAISLGIRIPDGILLSYPALYLNKNSFTKSLALSLEDLLLPHTFLKLCLESYIQDPRIDPEGIYVSPLQASSDLLGKLPKTRLIIGDDDPLYDHTMVFVEKLIDANADVHCTVFKATPHGVLNFYLPGGVKESKGFYKKTIEYFRELISNN